MKEQLKDGPAVTTASNQKPSIDPLRRVFVPIEKRTPNGTWVFKTTDQTMYFRAPDGSMRRVQPKVNGKDARRARRLQRAPCSKP